MTAVCSLVFAVMLPPCIWGGENGSIATGLDRDGLVRGVETISMTYVWNRQAKCPGTTAVGHRQSGQRLCMRNIFICNVLYMIL